MRKNLLTLSIIFLLSCLWTAPWVVAEDAKPNATIGSIDGGATVEVVNQGQSRQVSSGEALQPGDQVLTGAEKTATVLIPDGSVLIVGRKSTIDIQSAKDASAAVGVQYGTIRAIVGKANKLRQAQKYRFFIRTKAAVLGVRGTDFVVTANQSTGVTQVHTLEGAVEVAQTEPALVEKGGVAVRGGESIEATPEKIGQPQVFDRERFAEEMKAVQPSLEVPATAPAPEPSPSPSGSPESASKKEEPIHKRSALWSFQFYLKHIQPGDLKGMDGLGTSWNPTWTFLGQWLGLRGHVGTFLAGKTADFPGGVRGVEVGGAISFRILGHFLLEPGILTQHWSQGSMGGPSLQAGWELQKRLFGLLDRFFLGATVLGKPKFYQDLPNNQSMGSNNCPSNTLCRRSDDMADMIEVKAGIGFRF